MVPLDSFIGELPVVPVGDTGTIPYGMQQPFLLLMATAARMLAIDAGCVCQLTALDWTRDI